LIKIKKNYINYNSQDYKLLNYTTYYQKMLIETTFVLVILFNIFLGHNVLRWNIYQFCW